jgi:hypothetical protein
VPDKPKKCATCVHLEANPPKFKCLLANVPILKEDTVIEAICPDWVLKETVLSAGVGSLSKGTLRKGTDMIPEFAQSMLRKWERGKSEYGLEILIDPYDEAMGECIDLANYSMMIYFRLKTLKEKVHAIADKTSNS